MRELITDSQADAVFNALLIAGIVAGAVVWFAARRRSRVMRVRMTLRAGIVPISVGFMWHFYEEIVSRLGLDTVANLAVNGAVFVVVGGGIGWVFSYLLQEEEVPAAGDGETV